jgi:PAS domain-containing protein
MVTADSTTAAGPPIRVAVERDPTAALARLEDADCVVVGELPSADATDFLDAAADRAPSLPVVRFADRGGRDGRADVGATATDFVSRDPGDCDGPPSADPYRRPADRVASVAAGRDGRTAEEVAASRFRSLAESLPDALVVLDDDDRIRYVNPAVERVFGYPPEAVRGDPVSVLFPETGGDGVGVGGGAGSVVELAGRHREGHDVDVEVSTGRFADDGDVFFPCVVRPAEAGPGDCRR